MGKKEAYLLRYVYMKQKFHKFNNNKTSTIFKIENYNNE